MLPVWAVVSRFGCATRENDKIVRDCDAYSPRALDCEPK